MLAIFIALILATGASDPNGGPIGPHFNILGTPGLHFDGDPLINMWTPRLCFSA